MTGLTRFGCWLLVGSALLVAQGCRERPTAPQPMAPPEPRKVAVAKRNVAAAPARELPPDESPAPERTRSRPAPRPVAANVATRAPVAMPDLPVYLPPEPPRNPAPQPLWKQRAENY